MNYPMTSPKTARKTLPPEDRTDDLIRFFVSRLSGSIGRTRLVKLLYLADLEARRYLGRPVSRLSYRLDQYGPFDPKIFRTIEALEEKGEIRSEVRPVSAGTWVGYHSAVPVESHPFSPAEEAVLAFVLKTYASKDLDELLEGVVYETAPMKKVRGKPLKTPLPMDLVNDEARHALGGIDLETALRGAEDVQHGKTVRWEELKGELQDRAIRDRGK